MKQLARQVAKNIAEKIGAAFNEKGNFRFKKFSLTDLSIPRGLHLLVEPFFKRYGFDFETVEKAGTQIGLWRKVFDETRQSKNRKRIVFVPGLGDTPLSWLLVTLPLRNVLPQHYDEIVFLDFPGFQGFLSSERAFTSIDDMILSTNEVLDDLQPHTVLGHSLGGWLSAYYAIHAGEEKHAWLKQTILVSNPGIITETQEMLDWKAKFDSARTEGIEAFRKYLFVNEPVWFGLFTKEFNAFFEREDIVSFLDSIGRHHFVTEQVGKIQSHLILLWGAQDELNLPSWSQGWKKNLNYSKTGPVPFILVHGVSHNLHIELPAVTSTVLGKIIMNHGLSHSHKWTTSVFK